jgi:hypothetical protein
MFTGYKRTEDRRCRGHLMRQLNPEGSENDGFSSGSACTWNEMKREIDKNINVCRKERKKENKERKKGELTMENRAAFAT